MIISDLELLKYLPFLSNSGEVVRQINITVDKIENTNTFNEMLRQIYQEITFLLTSDKDVYVVDTAVYEVSRFYLTILLLKGIDNIAITRIWIKNYMKKIDFNIKTLLDKCKTEQDRNDLFLRIFYLLEANHTFELKRVTIEGETGFGLHMLKYLDVFDTLITPYPVSLHKGFIIIPYESTTFLTTFIQKFAEQKIYKLYEKAELDVSITRKIKLTVDMVKKDVLNSQKVSINTKKHFIKKELLQEQERIADVERASKIIKEIEDPREKEMINVKSFPPCVNVILQKLIITKEKLSHNENILLCTYLGKKQFDINQVKKIFSKAANYDKGTTDYQVTFLYNKKMMPMNCSNLGIEGICKMDLDKTNQCGKIKNPLSYR